MLELFSTLADDRLDEQQQQELVRRLCEDERARALYLRFSVIESLLPREARRERPRPIMPDPAQADTRGESSSPILGFLGNCFNQGGSFFTAPTGMFCVLVLVFSVILGGMGISGYLLWTDMRTDLATAVHMPITGERVTQKDTGNVTGLLASGPGIAARIVRVEDARWVDPAFVPSPGDPLQVGEVLQLAGGTVEIAFDCGAVVTLEGPARFEINSPLAGMLHLGRVSVEVPEEAHGFVIEAPWASIVDLGTSFSVDVDQSGAAETVVHEGEIRMGIPGSQPDSASIHHLQKGQAARVSRSADGLPSYNQISASDVKWASPKLKNFRPVAPQEIAGLRLWLRADAGTYRDVEAKQLAEPGDPVARWIDQSGNGLSPLQRAVGNRPRLVLDAGGHLALRFDGRSQRLEQPSKTGPANQVLDHTDCGVRTRFTICLVFTTARVETLDEGILFGQFVDASYGSNTSRLVGIDLGACLIHDEWPPGAMYLRTDINSLQVNKTYLVVVTRDDDFRSIHVNGQLAASDNQAETYAGNRPSLWWIGGRSAQGSACQFFEGDIAELVIFTRALSPETRHSVEAYLTKKYL